ncbi:hypothetical protein TrVFT333_010520 [Trichoderma virens FT-333]|nr:hypothetical protein TrVFT333_010520 [Trichoderma virens FT-333]
MHLPLRLLVDIFILAVGAALSYTLGVKNGQVVHQAISIGAVVCLRLWERRKKRRKGKGDERREERRRRRRLQREKQPAEQRVGEEKPRIEEEKQHVEDETERVEEKHQHHEGLEERKHDLREI